MVDVTTPVTAERYTNNFHGWQPWPLPVGSAKVMRKGLSKTLPGLRDFYMVGQWAVAMIGVSTAAALGRNLVRVICRETASAFGR